MMGVEEQWSALRLEAAGWARGKNWVIRAPLLVFFFYVLVRSLADPLYFGLLGPLNLGIHELGHFLFGYFGQFLAILGGSFWECAAPLIGMWNFYRQRDFFAIALCFGWLSTALFHVATYIADARAMELPLVTPFGGLDSPLHDWNYLLGQMGLLAQDQAVAFLFRAAAVVAMGICFAAGIWLVRQMMSPSDKDGLQEMGR